MKSVCERQESRPKEVWGSRAVPRPGNTRTKATWGARITATVLLFACALTFAAAASAQGRRFPKMDRGLEQAAITGNKSHTTTVIVTLEPGADLPGDLQKFSRFGRLNGLEAHVLDVPDNELKNVANRPEATHVHADSVVHGF